MPQEMSREDLYKLFKVVFEDLLPGYEQQLRAAPKGERVDLLVPEPVAAIFQEWPEGVLKLLEHTAFELNVSARLLRLTSKSTWPRDAQTGPMRNVNPALGLHLLDFPRFRTEIFFTINE